VRQTTKKQGQQTDMTVQRLRDVRVWQRAPRVQKILYSQTTVPYTRLLVIYFQQVMSPFF